PIEITIKAEEHVNRVPILRVGKSIRFHLKSPMAGYLTLFHVDANGFPQIMFPDEESIERYSVVARKTILAPKDLEEDENIWSVTETAGKKRGIEKIVAVVTQKYAKLEVADLGILKIDIKMRGMQTRRKALKELKSGSYVIGQAEYEMREPLH
ncbi:MAG: DUF4384 domain-containing protein, partial [Candidatus Thorarchaeota archaeon]